MYNYLSGKLMEKTPTSVIIEVAGIGYDLTIPVSTYASLPALGEQVKLLTHFVVREDAQLLYGFATEEERKMFRMLISISGIGPKIANTALSGILVEDLKAAIKEGNVAVLTSVSGIGKKTAERIVIELREKVILEGGKTSGAKSTSPLLSSEAEDAVQALIALGYSKNEAQTAVDKAQKSAPEKLAVDKLVRNALRHI
ncbi:MAG TPA: Holliday junction branch migration protein RuvA [Candidatus Omnitrophota bacterium]|nr:Holliday junction branch migration protein RuvA [Candidatus Omnitrophota bacterium]